MPEQRDERVAFGGMEVLGRLSTGGMGEVLLARKRGAHGFEKLIAVKTIRGDLARRNDMRRMFLDEARLMARLDHPAIAQIYDFGEEKDVLYLAMEYVPGIALSKLLKRAEMKKEPVPPGIAARMVCEVCRGLHAAHELKDNEGRSLGVVHRDVSPHNLMLTFDGRVKILDFGIAWRRDREAPETEIGVIKGKISYVAPEQITGGDIDRRSDVYSAAVVLHELLVGRKLFAGQGVSLADTLQRNRIPRPASVVKTIPNSLDQIVMRALSPKIEDRFQDAREMAGALEKVYAEIGGETVEEFAERELAEEREIHRARIQAITQEGPPRELAPVIPPKESETLAERPASKSASSRSHAPKSSSYEVEPPKRSSKLGPLLVIALAGGAALFLFYPSRTDPTSVLDKPPAAPVRTATSVARPEPKEKPKDPPPPVVEPPPPDPVATATSAIAAMLGLTDTASETSSVAEAEESTEDEPYVEDTPETPPIPPLPAIEPPPPPAKTTVVQKVRAKAPPPVSKKAPPRPVAKAKAPAKKPTPGIGYLTIESAVSVVAIVDGKNYGLTPINNLRLGAGRHDVQLRHPVSRVLKWKNSVTVQSGKRHRLKLR